MEPRSFDRGDRNADGTLTWKRTASMEPRSFDRGDTSASPLSVRLRIGASMEPRSFDRGDEIDRGLLVIVRRASMEPRSFDRGDPGEKVSPHQPRLLQWSRGLLTAETSLSLTLTHSLTRLQWSRGLLTAETKLRARDK